VTFDVNDANDAKGEGVNVTNVTNVINVMRHEAEGWLFSDTQLHHQDGLS